MQPGESVQDTRRRLEEFKGWLRQRRLVPENRIPFVVIWVERFLRATRPRENWKDSLRVFLQDLEAGDTLDWQLRQSADAVALYCGQFCSREVTQSSPQDHSLGQPTTARGALAEMGRLMRLRHYAPRTERSYLSWVCRFFRHVHHGGVPNPNDVKPISAR